MIDTHAHLDALDEDPTAVVGRAREAGVTRILTVGMAEAVALAERFDGVFAIVGIHPHHAADGDLDVELARTDRDRVSLRHASPNPDRAPAIPRAPLPGRARPRGPVTPGCRARRGRTART